MSGDADRGRMTTQTLHDAVVAVPERIATGLERGWRQLTGTGTWFTSAERIAAIAEARAALDAPDGSGTEGVVDRPARDAVRTVAAGAARIDREYVERLAGDGLEVEPYVELVGVVSRAVAIDTTVRGVGASELPLPAPESGTPEGSVATAARRRSAFVPTVGAAGPPTALSAVPAEDRAQEDLHGALYLSYGEMGDATIVTGLPRWQLELIAARTSLINHCHF